MRRLLLLPFAVIRLLIQSTLLALGQIWANKMRSVLTTIGIVIGVASVTAVIAALVGLKAKVMTDLESFGTNKIFIQPHRPNQGPKSNVPWWRIRFLPEHFDGLLEHCPSVAQFSMVNWGGREVIRNDKHSVNGIRVFGIEPSWHKIENREILFGRPFSIIDESQGNRVCMIDPGLRDELRLDKDCIGQSILIGNKIFRITGIIERRPENLFGDEGIGQSSSKIFIPFKTNLKLRRFAWIWADASSMSTEVSEEAQAEITFFLRRTRRIKPGEPDTFRIQSVESFRKKFDQIAIMITVVAGGIVGISLLVGGVGIMNIMLVSVSERTREIGLRKAVGAKKSAILTQFLVEAVVLCFIGGLAGVGFGYLITMIIASVNPVMDKTQIPLWAILISFGFAGTVGIFFGMFPAIKAAQLDPIEALRHE